MSDKQLFFFVENASAIYFAIIPFLGISMWKAVAKREGCGEACSKLVDYYSVFAAHATLFFAVLGTMISYKVETVWILLLLLGEMTCMVILAKWTCEGFHAKKTYKRGIMRTIPLVLISIRLVLAFPYSPEGADENAVVTAPNSK